MAEKLYKTNRVTWNSLFRILRSRDNGEWKFEGGIIVQADGDFPVDGFYSFSKYWVEIAKRVDTANDAATTMLELLKKV